MIIECEEIAFPNVCNSCATEAKRAGNNGIIAQNGRNFSQNVHYLDILHLLEALDGLPPNCGCILVEDQVVVPKERGFYGYRPPRVPDRREGISHPSDLEEPGSFFMDQVVVLKE